MYDNIFTKSLPTVDLHGYDRDSAIVKVNDFINENIILNNKKIMIIHGIGEGILKKEIHLKLAKNKNISKFYIDPFNAGCTIIVLKNNLY